MQHRSVTAATIAALLVACGGSSASSGASPAIVEPPRPPVISAFKATPATVAPGATALLEWTVEGATSLTVDAGVGAVSGSSRAVTPLRTTTYTLTATNTGGSAQASVTVAVRPLPQVVSFTATPGRINEGGVATLAWVVTDADAVTIDQGIGAVAGSAASVSPAAATTYTLTATNSVGTATASTTLGVLLRPVILSFRAEPTNVPPGRPVTLSWSVAGADTLTLDHGIGAVFGEGRVVYPAESATYELVARNEAGEARSSAAVMVSSVDRVQVADATVSAGRSVQLVATVTPGSGSPDLTTEWSLPPGSAGTLSPLRGGTTTYSAPSATGTYAVRATSVWQPEKSGTATISVTGVPRVDGFSPATAAPGARVQLSGTAFTAATAVRFNGVAAASYRVESDSTISAVVPAEATIGPVSVTTPSGSASSVARFFPLRNFDLSIASAHVTQSTQTFVSSVPLVAGRPGLLRVFVAANSENIVRPDVEIRLIDGGSTRFVKTIAAPATSAPTILDEGDLASSWNLPLSASDLVASGTLRLQITVDPANAITEVDESNNSVVLDLAPVSVPEWHVTLVPIVLSSGVGDVSESNRGDWVDVIDRQFPLAGIDARVGTPFTPSVSSVADAAGWNRVLSELDARRAVEAPERYYYGAIPTGGDTGPYAGLGYLGYPTAIGLDPGYWEYAGVLAHEVGHNFNRYHAPCGDPANVDPNWPTDPRYADASIGTWGWDARPDVSGGEMKSPGTFYDVMSYCRPWWPSDYTYEGVLAFRQSSSYGVTAAGPARASLLVSGAAHDGAVELRPAFGVDAVPSPDRGDHSIELQDGAGRVLRRISFDWLEVPDAAGGERHFTVVVPLGDLDPARVQRIAVVHANRELARAERRTRTHAAREPRAQRSPNGRAAVAWDADVAPAVMVRDPRTGAVLGFGAGGTVSVVSGAAELELRLSDGVTSETRLVRVSDVP